MQNNSIIYDNRLNENHTSNNSSIIIDGIKVSVKRHFKIDGKKLSEALVDAFYFNGKKIIEEV